MRMPIDHVRYERLPASSQTEGDVADVDRDRQPFCCGAPIGRGTSLACLTLRDNFKIFRDVGLYATPLVQQHPSATGSISMPKSRADPSSLAVAETLVALISTCGRVRVRGHKADRQDGKRRAVQEGRPYRAHPPAKDQPKRRSSKTRRDDTLRSELASWSTFHPKLPCHPFY